MAQRSADAVAAQNAGTWSLWEKRIASSTACCGTDNYDDGDDDGDDDDGNDDDDYDDDDETPQFLIRGRPPNPSSNRRAERSRRTTVQNELATCAGPMLSFSLQAAQLDAT